MRRLFAATIITTLCVTATAFAGPFDGKKVLHISSYDDVYPWSHGIAEGIKSVIGPSGAELKIVYMDTKNNPGEDFKTAKAAEMKSIIEQYKPDVVITADDNAVKYVIVPYFKGAALPFVFNGVNWDATKYGLPTTNVTGMEEVAALDELIALLRKSGAGERMAALSVDQASERSEVDAAKGKFGVTFVEERYVTTFDEWKKAYLELQGKADALFVVNNAGLKGWNDAEAVAFVEANGKIPSGSLNDWMAPYGMLIFAKVAAEQGVWSAEAALKILGGAKPSDIPVAHNVKGDLIVNARIAQKLNIKLPIDLLEAAQKVIE